MRKIVLLTGASSGIGQALAYELTNKNYLVYGTSRNINLLTPKNNFYPIRLDLTNYDSIKSCVDYIIKKEGKIDILINNAGIMLGGPIELADKDEIKLIFETNIIGPICLINEVLPHMRKENNGLIINIGSIGGIFGLPFQGIYSSTKFAINGITQALSLETENFGIKTVTINPGDTKTNVIKNRIFPKKLKMDNVYQKQFNITQKIIENEESSGLSPIYVSKKIVKIIEKKKLKSSYIIASPIQKLSCFVYKILGFDIFKKILKIYYKIEK